MPLTVCLGHRNPWPSNSQKAAGAAITGKFKDQPVFLYFVVAYLTIFVRRKGTKIRTEIKQRVYRKA